jgi:hypothetical protein
MTLDDPKFPAAKAAFDTLVAAMTDDELQCARAAHDATTKDPGDELHLYKSLTFEAVSIQRFGFPTT